MRRAMLLLLTFTGCLATTAWAHRQLNVVREQQREQPGPTVTVAEVFGDRSEPDSLFLALGQHRLLLLPTVPSESLTRRAFVPSDFHFQTVAFTLPDCEPSRWDPI